MVSNSETFLTVFTIAFSGYFCDCFKVYWNVPSEHCQKFGITFNVTSYNIIQNSQDKFYGEKINIIYSPGHFPSYDAKDRPVDGGIPQKADVVAHIARFEKQVAALIPKKFNGYAVLDFESYQPYYDIASEIYKNASRTWVREKSRIWPEFSDSMVDYVARKTFNHEAEFLYKILLEVGKILRPEAKWGYYHFPYCENSSPEDMLSCTRLQTEANIAMKNIFKDSGALFPSIYVYKNGFNSSTRAKQMKHRLTNAIKIREETQADILPYFWFKYHDNKGFLDPIDLWSTLGVAWHLKLEGAIIWGESENVATKSSCLKLLKYVEQYLGPVVELLTDVPAETEAELADIKRQKSLRRDLQYLRNLGIPSTEAVLDNWN